MTQIVFSDAQRFAFARQFLATTAPGASALHPDDLSADIADGRIARLIMRLANGQVTVLPYLSASGDLWMIVGGDRHGLDVAVQRVSHFVVPSYAQFGTGQSYPQLRLFDPDGNALQRAGAALFPDGFYSWRSPCAHRDQILNHLDLWMRVMESEPQLQRERKTTYRELYDSFLAALAAGVRTDAEAALREMQRSGLTGADNLAFLDIHLAAAQARWREVWERIDYPDLARLPVPRPIRADMLSAFYYADLLRLEQEDDIAGALREFSLHRARLGSLLTTRLDLDTRPVLGMFAYEAAHSGDREGLDALAAVNDSDGSRHVLDALREHLPSTPEPAPPPPASAIEAAYRALVDEDYDTAFARAREIEVPSQRTIFLLQIAHLSGDALRASEAMRAWRMLPEEEHQSLIDASPVRSIWLESVKRLAPLDIDGIEAWDDWLRTLKDDPSDKRLARAFESIKMRTDDRYWTPERLEYLPLQILDLATDPATAGRAYTRAATQFLTTSFLSDELFPRADEAYMEVYSQLFDAWSNQREMNPTSAATVLELARAILGRSLSQAEKIRESLAAWFERPIPRLEPYVLDAFGLLADAGIEGWQLESWYRDWIDILLTKPQGLDRLSLEQWRKFGRWVHTSDNILEELGRRIQAPEAQGEENPIALLPKGYRIAIFTLHERSAQEARARLLDLNPDLDIAVNTDKDVSSRAVTLTSNADMVVLVTDALKHTMFHGLMPHIRGTPVYPPSKGMMGILRAIEDRARQSGPGQAAA